MATLQFNAITDFITATVESFRREVQTSGRYAYRGVVPRVEAMDYIQDAGQLAPHIDGHSQKNRDLINEIGFHFYDAVGTQILQSRIVEMALAMKEINKTYVEYYEDRFGDLSSEAIRQGDSIVASCEDLILRSMGREAIFSEVFDPAMNYMFNALSQQVTKTVFLNNVENKIKHRIEHYLVPLSSSILQSCSRDINNLYADSFQLVWVEYVRRTSQADRRDFCVHHESSFEGNPKHYHIDEVKIEWAKWREPNFTSKNGTTWSGQIPGTTGDNIMTVAGGYNCLHTFEYVFASLVSRQDKQRARQKGFIL